MKALFRMSACVGLIVCIACGGSSTPTPPPPPPPSSGELALTISGLPAGTNASVTVTGPGNFNQVVSATQTLTGLAPGNYTVTANNVTRAPYSYGVTVTGSPATVSTSAGASATVSYAAATGAIQLNITGTPAGTNSNVTVTGPGGFNQTVTGSQVLGTLVPGTYSITASEVRASGNIVDRSMPVMGAPLQSARVQLRQAPSPIAWFRGLASCGWLSRAEPSSVMTIPNWRVAELPRHR